MVRIKIRQCERVLLKSEIQMNKVMDNLISLKNILIDVISVGQHIMCHKEIKDLERRVDPNIRQLQEKYRKKKNDLLENILDFFLDFIDKHFSRYDRKQNFTPSAEFNQSLILIKSHWESTFQDMVYFQNTLDLIIVALRKVVDARYKNEENLKKWSNIFGKFSYEFFKLKQILNDETPFINIKKESSSFYHIVHVIIHELEKFFEQDLANSDSDHIFRMTVHFIDVAASTFMVSNIWHIFFQENEYIMSEIPNEFNFKDPFMEIYGKSGKADINYRTCSILNEFEEVLFLHQKITESLNQVSFTYDTDLITNLEDYKPALDNIYNEICVTEADGCLDVLFDEKTIQTFARIILKVDSSFNKRLVKLRKFGPITHIGISQNVFEEDYYIKMGYMAPYQNSDKSIMLWVCRNCGGNYAISEIKFQKGNVNDFASNIPNPTNVLNLFQVYNDIVLVAERILMDSYVLSPSTAEEDNDGKILLSNILWDDDKNSSEIWESKGYINTKTGFYLLYNHWNTNQFDWMLTDYPKIFNSEWTLENKCFCIITIGNSLCKKQLLEKFPKYLFFEDSFDEYALWTFRTENENLTISNLQEQLQYTECRLLNIFETKPNGNFALIDDTNKNGLNKEQMQGDRMAANLFFERVPQKQLYICYKWLYPMEESKEIESKQLSLVHIKHILREINFDKIPTYRDIICDPTSRRFCSFIDDDYLKKRSYLDVHIVGISASFPLYNSYINYVNDLNVVITEESKKKCKNAYDLLPNIDPFKFDQTDDFFKKIDSNFHSIADNECEISKAFHLQIPCPNRLKFIYQKKGYSIDYICSETFEEIEANLTKEERIPVDRDIFLYVKITQTPMDKIHFDLDKIKELNYYYLAYWMVLPLKKYVNKNQKQYYFISAILIKINYHHFNFIGLPDTYSHTSCIELNNNYDRYKSKNKKHFFSGDSFFFRHQQAFFNAIEPKKLEFYQEKYNLGSVDSSNWRIYLKKTQCEFQRFWIPIVWQGDGANSCHNFFSGK